MIIAINQIWDQVGQQKKGLENVLDMYKTVHWAFKVRALAGTSLA